MTWSVLQSNSSSGSVLPSMSCQYTANLTAGTVLLAFVTAYLDHATAVSDGNGNAFTQVGAYSLGSETVASSWALATPPGDAGTKPTVTATLNSGSGQPYQSIVIQEVAGISATPDGTAGVLHGTSSGAGSAGPPSYASTQSGGYLVYMAGDDGDGVTFSTPSGYTLDPNSLPFSSNASLAVAYKSSTGTTESGAWGVNVADDYVLIMAAFPLSGAAPAAHAPYLIAQNTGFF